MGLVIQSVKPNHFNKELLKYIFMKLDFINIWWITWMIKLDTQELRYSNLKSGSLYLWLCITTNILWRGYMYNKVLRYNLLIRPRVQYIYIVVLNIINGNFGPVKSW